MGKSDLFSALDPADHTFDLIISNPPYIPTDVIQGLMPEVRDHEPLMALDGREDGLYYYRKISGQAREFLKTGGYLMYEIGYDQGQSVPAIMKELGYQDVQVIKDYAGLDRVVCGQLHNGLLEHR